jgi:hypothetical protein
VKNFKKNIDMPEISKFYGIVISMLFDDHNPPHFHVKYGDYRAQITIKDGTIKGILPRRALNLVYEWLDLHREELLENWKRIENRQILLKVEPLQ